MIAAKMITSATPAVPADSQSEEANLLRQKEFGFWLFLMSDAIVFALLFATYAVMSQSYAGGPEGRQLFSLARAFGETMLLLFSSLTFGLATIALMRRESRRALAWLGFTFVLGFAFVAMEFMELRSMIVAGAGPDRSGFLSAFFTLLATHGLHVAMGLVFIVILSISLALQGPTRATLSRLARLGQYWHFLDIVWIGIYSVVYLTGMV